MSGQPGDCFKTLDVTQVRRLLSRLHQQVANSAGRIEIKRRGCEDVCVIISKAELEALEQALEFMAETAEFKQACEMLSQLAAATSDGYAAVRT